MAVIRPELLPTGVAHSQWKPKGEHVALVVGAAIAALAVYGMIALLGANGISMTDQIAAGATSGVSIIATVATPILLGRKEAKNSKEAEEDFLTMDPFLEEAKPHAQFFADAMDGTLDGFVREFEGNGSRSYLVRNKADSGWVVVTSIEDLEAKLLEIGYTETDIRRAKLVASQVAMTPVTEKVVKETEKLPKQYTMHSPFLPQDKESYQVYLFSMRSDGPEVDARYRFELAPLKGGFGEYEKEYQIARTVIHLSTGEVEPILGDVTDLPQPFEI